MLACDNHEIGPLTERRLRTLAHMPAEELAAEVQRWLDAFQDPSWRMAELQWLLQGGSSAIDRRLFAGAEDELMLKGTARDYAHVMSHVITGTFISPEVSRTMRSFLEWPMQFPNVRAAFAAWGNKGGSSDGGILTDVNYYVPTQGDFAGTPMVSVLFMRRIPFDIFDSLTHQGPGSGMNAGLD